MGQDNQKQYNSTISVFRALAALFVISQHVPYEGSLQIVYYFMCTAVPFFFLVAGYFSWNQDEKVRKNKILKHLKKISIVYVLAYLFYYMISVGLKYAANALFHTNMQVEFENWNILQIIKGILLDIDPFASHLWFLYSMIIIYILLWIFHSEKMIIPGFFVAVVLFLVAHTKFGSGSTLATIRVAVTSSFSSAYFGYYIHCLEEKNRLNKKNRLFVLILLVVLAYVITKYYLSRIFIYNDVSEYIAFVVFMFAVKYKNIGEGTLIEKLGRKYTLEIYIFHIFIMHIIERIISKMGFIPDFIWKEIKIFVVFLTSLCMVICLRFISERIARLIKKK